MSNYSYFDLIKREAKVYAAANGLRLSAAQEDIARSAGFSNYHELVAVSKRNPHDPRLMMRAVGVGDFADVIYPDRIWIGLDSLVDEALSDAISETYATGFTIENLVVNSSAYDESVGVLLLDLSFEYLGEQDEDRPWHGSAFYIDAEVRLIFREGWGFVEDDPLIITDCKSDQDLDREMELEYEIAKAEADPSSPIHFDGPAEGF